MSKPLIRPLGDRVLVKPIEVGEQVRGGIVIPDSAKEKPQEYEVLALGDGTNKDGEKIEMKVKAGDHVLTSKYGGTDIKWDDKEYKIVSYSDILAVIG